MSVKFGDLMYSRLPDIYKVLDCDNEYTLKRYLSALGDDGLSRLYENIVSLYSYWDIDTCPKEWLPSIAKMLGYIYIDEVEEKIQRKIIKNLVELYKRKGTSSALTYITREFFNSNTKLIELQYRIFRTWSKTSVHAPSTEPKPKTMKMTGKDDDTFFLFSAEGKYNYDGIEIIIDKGDSSKIRLLRRLLDFFTPVFCKLYIKITDEIIRETGEIKFTDKSLENILIKDTVAVSENEATRNLKITKDTEYSDNILATDTFKDDKSNVWRISTESEEFVYNEKGNVIEIQEDIKDE